MLSLNNRDTKYELVYKVCSDATCTNFIDKPAGLSIMYSSKSVDSIFGEIHQSEAKRFSIVVDNTTQTTYYILVEVNAGFIYNTLELQNLITDEYNEEDLIIKTLIDGVDAATFPASYDYGVITDCQTNGSPTSAYGVAGWDGTKWILNVYSVTSFRTVCTVDFITSLKTKILAQEGGSEAIKNKGTPSFGVLNGTSGLYATTDNYGPAFYYRGEKDDINNNVIWAGFQWKIIRLNGGGSIRLIYNGTCPNDSCTINNSGVATQISGLHSWNNNNYNDAKYLGYMYGGPNGSPSSTLNGAIQNSISNNVKGVIDTWYQTNILGKSFENQIVDNLFCNDRKI